MDKFKELVTLCLYPVSISVNEHKANEESIREYVDRVSNSTVPDNEILLMEKFDRVYEVIAYPRSNVSFYSYYSHDLDLAIEKVIEGVRYGK